MMVEIELGYFILSAIAEVSYSVLAPNYRAFKDIGLIILIFSTSFKLFTPFKL